MPTGPPALRRDYAAGLKAALTWIANPVSEHGVSQISLMVVNLAGPEFDAKRRAMRAHPMGRRLLQNRPDLGAVLGDMKRMAAMPEGSLGRAYYDFMKHPDTVPGYLLAGLAYTTGAIGAGRWDEELDWLLERLLNSHDITHVLAGYGADLAGETLNALYTMGIMDGGLTASAVGRAFRGVTSTFPTTVGRRRWSAALGEAFRRGRSSRRACPLECVYYEELLAMPLAEAQKMLGVPPLRRAAPDTSRWLRGRIFDRMAVGYGTMGKAKRRAKCAQGVVESGISLKELVRADEATRERLFALFDRGATGEELRQALG